MDEFRKALDANPKKAVAFKESLAGMTPESDGGEAVALSKAAAAVGFEISPEQIERELAAAMKLDDSELEAVGGGLSSGDESETGHDIWCLTIWHCHATSMHTDDKDGSAACWTDWRCFSSYRVRNPCKLNSKKEENCWTAWHHYDCSFLTTPS